MEKFKGYKPPCSAESAAPAESNSQSGPEEPKEASKAPEPNVAKSDQASHSGDHIFSSPVAKKLAEDNNVLIYIFSSYSLYGMHFLNLSAPYRCLCLA